MKYKNICPPGEKQSLYRQSLVLLLENDEKSSTPNPAYLDLKTIGADTRRRSPEQALLYELFFSTVNTIQYAPQTIAQWHTCSLEEQNNVLEAFAWLVSTETSWLYSLNVIVDYLGLHADTVRNRLLTHLGMTHKAVRKFLEQEGWIFSPAGVPKRRKRRRKRVQ